MRATFSLILEKKTSTPGCTRLSCLSPHLPQVSFPSAVMVPARFLPRLLRPPLFHPLSLPPLSVFLSVYLSTFTVTALVSQEFNLPPSLSHPHSRSMLGLSNSPSFSVTSVEIHTTLCVRGMKGPLYSPPRHPALSCSSHAQPPTFPRSVKTIPKLEIITDLSVFNSSDVFRFY